MSAARHDACPDWRALVARRERDAGAWEAAILHLDGCGRCFDAAVAAEPTLLFRRLPRPRAEAVDVEAMKRGVAALVRAREIERPAATSSAGPRTRRRLRRPARVWLSAAAAAIALGGTLLVTGLPSPSTVSSPAAPSPTAQATQDFAPDFQMPDVAVPAVAVPEVAVLTSYGLPLYEDVGAAGEMIQLVDHDADFLVFVGDDLDV